MWLVFIRGMLMGIADLVPGISGGTVAIITGIYQRLIEAISSVGFGLFKTLRDQGVVGVFRQVDALFLLAVFGGILTSIFLFAEHLKQFMQMQPILFWSTFSGFILSSIFLLNRDLHWRPTTIASFLIGVGVVLLSFTLKGNVVHPEWHHFFFAAIIAISAMILPGISGSLLLISMGMYSAVLSAVADRELMFLLAFAGGCVVGLMLMSRVIKWALVHYQEPVMTFLVGLMVGSLVRMWPWQQAHENFLDRLLMPQTWSAVTAQPAMLEWAILCVLCAARSIFVIERIAQKLLSDKPSDQV